MRGLVPILTLAAALAATGALSQNVPYGDFPGVQPPVPAPPPPAVAPGPAAPRPQPAPSPRAGAPSSILVPRLGERPVEVPGHRPGDSFSDRINRCIHYGTAAGVPPGEIGSFSAQCAQ
jgi:hypothetical protein